MASQSANYKATRLAGRYRPEVCRFRGRAIADRIRIAMTSEKTPYVGSEFAHKVYVLPLR